MDFLDNYSYLAFPFLALLFGIFATFAYCQHRAIKKEKLGNLVLAIVPLMNNDSVVGYRIDFGDKKSSYFIGSPERMKILIKEIYELEI